MNTAITIAEAKEKAERLGEAHGWCVAHQWDKQHPTVNKGDKYIDIFLLDGQPCEIAEAETDYNIHDHQNYNPSGGRATRALFVLAQIGKCVDRKPLFLN